MEPARQNVDEQIIQWVTFALTDEIYGIDVMSVQEVLRGVEITPVPGTPDYVLGIINLRGKVVTVLDTRQRFGLPSREMDDNSRVIVMEIGEDIIGILVDSVAEVVYLRQSEIDVAPNVGNRESSRYIKGVYSSDGELLILVDLKELLTDEKGELLSTG